MVELVRSEQALATPNVNDAIETLATVGEALKAHLDKMASKKGRLRGIIRQLIFGKKLHDTLERIMRTLGETKQELGLHIQLANVGLTRGVDRRIMVSIETVEAVSRHIQEALGGDFQLRIARLLEGREHNVDDEVTLCEDDIAFLSIENTSPAVEKAGRPLADRRWIARNNIATENALQVNTPIGVDVWEDIGMLRVERNQASGCALQLNAPMSAETFYMAMAARQPISV